MISSSIIKPGSFFAGLYLMFTEQASGVIIGVVMSPASNPDETAVDSAVHRALLRQSVQHLAGVTIRRCSHAGLDDGFPGYRRELQQHGHDRVTIPYYIRAR